MDLWIDILFSWIEMGERGKTCEFMWEAEKWRGTGGKKQHVLYSELYRSHVRQIGEFQYVA